MHLRASVSPWAKIQIMTVASWKKKCQRTSYLLYRGSGCFHGQSDWTVRKGDEQDLNGCVCFQGSCTDEPLRAHVLWQTRIRPLLGQKQLSLAKLSLWWEQPVFRMRSLKAVRIDQVWSRWNQVPKINGIREECRLLQTFVVKNTLNAHSLFGLKDASASSFCHLLSLRIQGKERKKRRKGISDARRQSRVKFHLQRWIGNRCFT